MSNYDIKKFKQVAAVAALVLFSMQSMSVGANSQDRADGHRDSHHKKHHHERTLHGMVVTGVNDVLGKPFFSWGPPYGPFHFPTLGVYNENGSQPLPINENTPDSALLATMVDPNFLIVSGATPADVKPEWVNVPLRKVPVNVDFAFVNKAPLPSVLQSVPLRPAQVEPGEPITLGQWMSASGSAKISCKGDHATLNLHMRNLLPKRLYTVWGTLGLPRDGSAVTFFPIPLGGTPNMFVTDENGDALFKRVIKFCPFEPESTLRPLLTINVQYHANHQSYGAVPEPGFLHGWWQGVVTFNHVVFPVNVERLDR